MPTLPFTTLSILTALVLVGLTASAGAVGRGPSCPVPSAAHPSIQQAIDDPVCSVVSVAAGNYQESLFITRKLSLVGPGAAMATVRGQMVVTGAVTVVGLEDLELESGCRETLVVRQGADVVASGLEVIRTPSAPCPAVPIFLAGFETGDTTEWTHVSP